MDSINNIAGRVILTVVLISMSACSVKNGNPNENTDPQKNQETYVINHDFHACLCDDMFLDLYKETVYETGGQKYYMNEPLNNGTIGAEALVVAMWFSGKDADKNTTLERAVTYNVYTRQGTPPSGVTGVFEIFTYHPDPIADIKITASSTLFGRASGERLDDLWEMSYRKYVIADYHYKSINDTLSLTDYVSMFPMPDNVTYLKLRSRPQELPSAIDLTFEITFTSGKVLTRNISVSLT